MKMFDNRVLSWGLLLCACLTMTDWDRANDLRMDEILFARLGPRVEKTLISYDVGFPSRRASGSSHYSLLRSSISPLKLHSQPWKFNIMPSNFMIYYECVAFHI